MMILEDFLTNLLADRSVHVKKVSIVNDNARVASQARSSITLLQKHLPNAAGDDDHHRDSWSTARRNRQVVDRWRRLSMTRSESDSSLMVPKRYESSPGKGRRTSDEALNNSDSMLMIPEIDELRAIPDIDELREVPPSARSITSPPQTPSSRWKTLPIRPRAMTFPDLNRGQQQRQEGGCQADMALKVPKRMESPAVSRLTVTRDLPLGTVFKVLRPQQEHINDNTNTSNSIMMKQKKITDQTMEWWDNNDDSPTRTTTISNLEKKNNDYRRSSTRRRSENKILPPHSLTSSPPRLER